MVNGLGLSLALGSGLKLSVRSGLRLRVIVCVLG